MIDHLRQRDRLLRIACLLMVAAIGLYAAYAGLFQPKLFQETPNWAIKWSSGYAIFVGAYILAGRSERSGRQRVLMAALAVQSAMALLLVWLFPSFIVTCLVVVTAWQ